MLERSRRVLTCMQTDDPALVVVPLREKPDLIQAPIPWDSIVSKQQQQQARFDKPIFYPLVPINSFRHFLGNMKIDRQHTPPLSF